MTICAARLGIGAPPRSVWPRSSTSAGRPSSTCRGECRRRRRPPTPTPSRASVWRCCSAPRGARSCSSPATRCCAPWSRCWPRRSTTRCWCRARAPRSALLAEFRRRRNAVLLATSSFWQGVDVVGDALSCVIIDKLPFASPGDPITAARIEAMTTQGGEPFADYQVPLAILTLLQGLGRLIRHRRTAACSPCSTRGCGRWVRPAVPGVAAAGADHARPRRGSPILRAGTGSLGVD